MAGRYFPFSFKSFVWLIVALLVLLYGLQWLTYADKYQLRQVNDFPESDRITPLYRNVTTHIRDTPRPEETFTFPVPLGGVGPDIPLYAGDNQHPFFCMTVDSKLGQPLVDNQQGLGVPVYEQYPPENNNHVIGYSKDCLIKTSLRYFFQNTEGEFKPFELESAPDSNDIMRVNLGGEDVPFIIRVETGSINRYLYMIAMPVVWPAAPERDSSQLWNKRLIYQFKGGSGIGFRQGKLRMRGIIERRAAQLAKGYAVVTSTANRTSYTYNMLLAEDTATRVKRQFTSIYGNPLYTVGVGGSGGGLAQYLIAQNKPGIIDAALPLYSYPDMISQTIYGLDCELIEHYFAITSFDRDKWSDWNLRRSILGVNTKQGHIHRYAWLQPINQLAAGVWPEYPDGNSECHNGWFGLTSLVHNPKQTYLRNYYSDNTKAAVNWTYWEDMVALFGRDKHGFANTTWDNRGVQYGLEALKNGEISPEEFIHLNRYIGGWKPQHQMEEERLYSLFGPHNKPLWLSLWSRHNITQPNEPSKTAERSTANLKAVQMAYRGGQVFIGNVDLPIIDIRHYLEPELNMHHVSASFEARQRIIDWRGNSDNHVIWVSHPDFDPQELGFQAMDDWMLSMMARPDATASDSRPAQIMDMCIDEAGNEISKGHNVWDGPWNAKIEGSCHQAYPMFSTSRIQAGGPWRGSVFICSREPVERALKRGVYHPVDMSAYLAQLVEAFPDGVCDYSKGDAGRPDDISPG
ncbi:DUF6351 family protein [Corallincola platygyrae]|uniref:DUF6351 family protein n=1 Tax=Corallincola platygyrae TaxID=1193278 RepID=A0ABW4XKU4_9GAMM